MYCIKYMRQHHTPSLRFSLQMAASTMLSAWTAAVAAQAGTALVGGGETLQELSVPSMRGGLRLSLFCFCSFCKFAIESGVPPFWNESLKVEDPLLE